MDKKESKMKGVMTVVGGVLIHLMIGNIYLWGNIEPYVISYFHYKGDPRAVEHNAIIIIPLSFSVQSIFNVVGSFLQQRMNPKWIMLLGSVISMLSIFIASQMQSWTWFVFFYGGIFPIGIGLLYWTPIICAWEWFPERKGMISGIIIGAFGFGAFLFGFITTEIVNPEDEDVRLDPINKEKYVPKYVADRVPEMFYLCIMMWSILLFLGAMCVSRNPSFT